MRTEHDNTGIDPAPQPGDVVQPIEAAEPITRPGGLPEFGDLVAIRLHGHPHKYLVRVETGPSGPRLVELRITPDDEATADELPSITYDTLRAVPARRLAHAAADWIGRAGGQIGFPGDTYAALARPEAPTARNKLDDEHYREVARQVRQAVEFGQPVRQTVAAALHTTVPTLDRWIRTAKDRGYLTETDIPRRKRPTGGTQR